MADEKKGLLPPDPPPSYDLASQPHPPPQKLPPKGGPKPPFPLQLPALNALRTKRLILASSSPRRQQILSLLGLPPFEIIPSHFAEDLPKSLSPFEYVVQTATQKALDVYRREINNTRKGEPGLILAADTINVSAAGEILEKPRSEADHVAMLKTLRDTGPHKCYTAVAVMAPLASARDPGYALETAVEETGVKFDAAVSDELIVAYVRTREGADKAGGYGLQGMGSILVERIEGVADNVTGLPLRVALRLMEKVVAKADDEDMLEGEEELMMGEEDEGVDA